MSKYIVFEKTKVIKRLWLSVLILVAVFNSILLFQKTLGIFEKNWLNGQTPNGNLFELFMKLIFIVLINYIYYHCAYKKQGTFLLLTTMWLFWMSVTFFCISSVLYSPLSPLLPKLEINIFPNINIRYSIESVSSGNYFLEFCIWVYYFCWYLLCSKLRKINLSEKMETKALNV